MYRLINRIGRPKKVPAKPILAAKRRRQLHPFFFSMGPVALSISSVILVSLMAVLYLSQLAQAVTASQKIQDIHIQQTTLERQNQDLANVIAQEQSPEYIAARARSMGLILTNPKNVQVLILKHLELIRNSEPDIQP